LYFFVKFLNECLGQGRTLDEIIFDLFMQFKIQLQGLNFLLQLLILFELYGDVFGLKLNLILELLVLDNEKSFLLF
jgi:hypothetical protein